MKKKYKRKYQSAVARKRLIILAKSYGIEKPHLLKNVKIVNELQQITGVSVSGGRIERQDKLIDALKSNVLSTGNPAKSFTNVRYNKKKFYASWEWRTLRMKIIQKHGRLCCCCGAAVGQTTLDGRPVKIVVDHIKPISKHWDLRLDPDNLQVLCDECNMGKGAWDETDWRKDT